MSTLSRQHATALSAVESGILTPKVLRNLTQHDILTVVEFVRYDTAKLQAIANLKAEKVNQLKKHMVQLYGPTKCDGLALKKKRMSGTLVLSTGLASLDALLTGGGLPTGSLVEICGYTNDGKTLLAESIALHFVRTHHVHVYYVSTKNACSGLRWSRLFKAGVGTTKAAPPTDGQPFSDIAAGMLLLRCESVGSLLELQLLIRGLLSGQIAGNPLDAKLVVVDSLTALLLPFQGDTHKAGLSQMVETLALLRQLADQQQKCVLVETLVLGDRKGESTVSTISRNWPSFASIRLLVKRLRKEPSSDDTSADLGKHNYEIVLEKSNYHRSGPTVACVCALGSGIE